MNFINYFSALLNYYKNSTLKTAHISSPNLTDQDIQQMLESKQQYLVPGLAYLCLFHGIWFFNNPGEENPKHVQYVPHYIMFGNNDHKYASLEAAIRQNKQYTDYTIGPRNNYISETSTCYVSNIDTDKKIIALDNLAVSAIIDPITLEQTIDASPEHKGRLAPVLTEFFKPVTEINPIPQNKQLKFVENCRQFEDWVRSQKKANIK